MEKITSELHKRTFLQKSQIYGEGEVVLRMGTIVDAADVYVSVYQKETFQ